MTLSANHSYKWTKYRKCKPYRALMKLFMLRHICYIFLDLWVTKVRIREVAEFKITLRVLVYIIPVGSAQSSNRV